MTNQIDKILSLLYLRKNLEIFLIASKFYNYLRALLDIQRRYDTFKGMDVDFSFFRTSYFEAKNNYTCFLKDCIDRNSPILKLVTAYHDDFELYLKKKETKYYRKSISAKT